MNETPYLNVVAQVVDNVPPELTETKAKGLLFLALTLTWIGVMLVAVPLAFLAGYLVSLAWAPAYWYTTLGLTAMSGMYARHKLQQAHRQLLEGVD